MIILLGFLLLFIYFIYLCLSKHKCYILRCIEINVVDANRKLEELDTEMTFEER